MDCATRQDQILLYASNALDEAEAEELRAHLATGCTKCAAALLQANEFAGTMLGSLEPVTPSAATRQNLMKRVMKDTVAPANRSADGRNMRTLGYAVAASIGLVVGMVIMYSRLAPVHDKLQKLEVALADSNSTITGLQRMVGSAQTQLVALEGQKPSPKARGRVFWDREKKQWQVYVFDLAPPAKGQTYELWFIAPNRKPIPGGTFDVDANGTGKIIASVPEGLEDLAVVAITNEPVGGTAAPTGDIHLMGSKWQ